MAPPNGWRDFAKRTGISAPSSGVEEAALARAGTAVRVLQESLTNTRTPRAIDIAPEAQTAKSGWR
jgi:hypothetical protein